MKTIRFLIFVLILSLGLVETGCKTSAPPTREAIVYYSFRDTLTVVHAAYDVFAEQVVLGKVKDKDRLDVEDAYAKFQSSFALAFRAASMRWESPPPEELKKLADDIITLIRSIP